MDAETETPPPKLPPAWFKHAFWHVHRALCRVSGGRFLWTPASKRGWGAARLTTIGRRSGVERSVIVGYVEDGPNLVVLAMNGWDEGHPAWWLNLQAHPDAVVRTKRQPPRPVRAVEATGTSAIACGSCGQRSTTDSTATRACDRSPRRSSCSNRPSTESLRPLSNLVATHEVEA